MIMGKLGGAISQFAIRGLAIKITRAFQIVIMAVHDAAAIERLSSRVGNYVDHRELVLQAAHVTLKIYNFMPKLAYVGACDEDLFSREMESQSLLKALEVLP
jgi:hypothetical protein